MRLLASLHSRLLVAASLSCFAVTLIGCGGGVDESEPVEIDPVMEQEAELSDQYMMEQEAQGGN
jgi:hypothetical protein